MIKVFRKKSREQITYDGSSMDKALSYTSVFGSSGTSGTIATMYKESEYMYQVWIAMQLAADTTYSSTFGDDYSSVELYNSNGVRVAYSEFSWDTGENIPLSYTPTAGGVYFLKYKTEYYDSEYGLNVDFAYSSGGVRPTDPSRPQYTPAETSEGFDAFGLPIGYKSAKEAGLTEKQLPQDGLVLHIPMSSSTLPSTAKTGQALTWTGNGITPTVYKNVACVEFPAGTYLSTGALNLVTGSRIPLTTSIWFNAPSSSGAALFITFDSRWGFHATSSSEVMVQWSCNDTVALPSGANVYDGEWHWIAATGDSTSSKVAIWYDGVKCSNMVDYLYGLSSANAFINKKEDSSSESTHYFAQVAVYDRVLSDEEMIALYEVKPPKLLKG